MKGKFVMIAGVIGAFLVLAWIMSQSSKAGVITAAGAPQTNSLTVNPITSGLSSLSVLLSGLSVGSVNGNPSPVSPTVYTAPAQGPTLSGGYLGQNTALTSYSGVAGVTPPPSLVTTANPTDTAALSPSPTGVSDPGLQVNSTNTGDE